MKKKIFTFLIGMFILFSMHLQTFALSSVQQENLSKLTEKAFFGFEKKISTFTLEKQIEKLTTLSSSIALVLQQKFSEDVYFVLNHLKNTVDNKSNNLKGSSQSIVQNQNSISTSKITITEELFNKIMKEKYNIEKDLNDKVGKSEIKIEDFSKLLSEKIQQLYLTNGVKEENIFYFDNLIDYYKDNERTNQNWKNMNWNEKISILDNTYKSQSGNIANQQEEGRKQQADLYFKKTGKDWYSLTQEEQKKFIYDNQYIDSSYYENFTYLTTEDKQKYLSEIKSKVNNYIEVNNSNEFSENGINKVLTINYDSFDYTIDTLLQMYLHGKINNIDKFTTLIKKGDNYFLQPTKDYKIKISISIDDLKRKVSKYSDKVFHLNGSNNIWFFSEKKVFFIEENGVSKFIIFPQGFSSYDGLDTLDGLNKSMLFSYDNNLYFAKEYKIVDIPNFNSFKILDRPDTSEFYIETFIPFDISLLNNKNSENKNGLYTSIDSLFEIIKNNSFNQYTVYKENSRLFLGKGNIKKLNEGKEGYISTTIKKLKEKMKYFEGNIVGCEVITSQNQTLFYPIYLYFDHILNEDEVVSIPDGINFNNNAIIKDIQTGKYRITLEGYSIQNNSLNIQSKNNTSSIINTKTNNTAPIVDTKINNITPTVDTKTQNDTSSNSSFTCGNSVSAGGFTYSTKKGLDGTCWTSENIKHLPNSGNNWCYNNDNYNCNNYGRLYDWDTAKTVCSQLGNGWKLPTLNQLAANYKSKSSDNGAGWKGNKLGGIISNLPGYYSSGNKSFNFLNNNGYWWAESSFYMLSLGSSDIFNEHNPNKNDGFSVMCVNN